VHLGVRGGEGQPLAGAALVADAARCAQPHGSATPMALAGALASCGLVVGGFSTKTLRPLVTGLLGPDAAPYTQGRCCYDLRRLKLIGSHRQDRAHKYLRPHPIADLTLLPRVPGALVSAVPAAQPAEFFLVASDVGGDGLQGLAELGDLGG
jgi:hypothetical protein